MQKEQLVTPINNLATIATIDTSSLECPCCNIHGPLLGGIIEVFSPSAVLVAPPRTRKGR